MVEVGVTAVRIVHGDTIFHVHGTSKGTEGVWLAKDQVDGIYDAPVTTTWKTGAFQDGSRQRARKWEHRDMKLGFHITENIASSYEFNDSEFRRLFNYELDQWEITPTSTTIEVETVLSGERKLDVLMFDTPQFEASLDPVMQEYGNIIMQLRAGQPMWYETDDTTVSGWHEDFYTNTTATGSGTVTLYNPTDQIMRQKWILTQATWVLPDFSWVGGPGERVPGGGFATRTISVPVTINNEGAVVDLDRQELMFRDAANSNILGQLAGKIFAFPIPPYTPPTELPVSYTGAPAGGAMVRLVQPRCWSRPWGLEMPAGS